ncbi:ATP-binding protein [Dysgonomonas sp. 216]|uniref:ATP-binding protein n=1 Tax=Dysgonomonas sp. 216 TaxID=2302934 RepID=UPI0013D72AA5|nr:ATP-binding protein [Dysgonomonas sp. 216]NDW18274.1 ATP-binding protein [Dysgonomonas sp. 216]NDW18642.1 ATP-binding protein [Dysgonomonas sp. 216]
MKVKLGQAVKMFFGNSSLEMVYFEAIANSLDAEASEININISIEAFNKPETFEIKISDNGLGFTDDRYGKFSRLFDVEESSHKGLGRLVYLCYFDTVNVSSIYAEGKKRDFLFSEGFKEENSIITNSESLETGSTFTMTGYTLQKIAKNKFVNPKYLKNRILEEFYPRLFKLKQEKQEIIINIETRIDETIYKESLNNNEIPNLEFVELDASINLIDKFQLYFSIEKTDDLNNSSFISAISVDNRTFNVDIIDKENTPVGYKMVFLLFSDFFRGKVDLARQNLTITTQELEAIQHLFRKKVASLIEERVPAVKKNNQQIRNNLVNTYPHLSGYFKEENIGYLRRNDILKNAQDEFFKAQKELLEAKSLDDEQFKKSLDISARALTEYILFRQLTINRLKNSNSNNSEAELHKLFADMGKDGRFLKEDTINDLYRNNAWLLDDKYMTYEITLSDREMTELVSYITAEEIIEKDSDRPDLAFIFSNSPNENKPFDIVIVELKKRGVGQYENLKAINQLETRARSLMKYYNNQIQRIWYYGIIEFDDATELALSGEYTELYSTGKMYYREKEVAISLNPKKTLPIGIFMWDIDAVVSDANARNQTFLNFIKSKFIS